MCRLIAFVLFFVFIVTDLFSQGFPWERPLKMAWSSDGVNFSTPVIFQDSAGVPSVIKWKGDTLVSTFQWFRGPVGSLSWDRVAIKFSYDNGITWTQPIPIVVNGIPPGFQRPFDPTLVVLNNDSLRIYFSSSDGVPMGGLDSTVNTYSAVSEDGVDYTFEPGTRVDEPNNRVIDPAVIYFNNSYHYISPIGSPQQGAYHYISPDGLNFSKVQDIPSDASHNWTGNYMINTSSELRFYGCGQGIWYKTTTNGGMWNAYVNTNIQGGDPTVVRTGNNSYLLIYVGNPYPTGIIDENEVANAWQVFPNPFESAFSLSVNKISNQHLTIRITDLLGNILFNRIESCSGYIYNHTIDLNNCEKGIYLLEIIVDEKRIMKKIVKQ